MNWPILQKFVAAGVRSDMLPALSSIETVRGFRGADGWFDEDPRGAEFLAFHQQWSDDVVFWCPDDGALATWSGRAFALGEDNIRAAATYAFDNYLAVHIDGLSWLVDGGRGIVVLDWSRAFDMLRDAPRVLVNEKLLATYRNAMRPPLPEVLVLADDRRAAA